MAKHGQATEADPFPEGRTGLLARGGLVHPLRRIKRPLHGHQVPVGAVEVEILWLTCPLDYLCPPSLLIIEMIKTSGLVLCQ